MHKHATTVILISLAALTALCAVLIGFAIFSPEARSPASHELCEIRVDGVYSVDGSGFSELSRGTTFDVNDFRTVRVRGHFSRDILPGESLFLPIQNLRVTMYIDHKKVFSIGDEGTYPSISRSPGMSIQSVTSKGIYSKNNVELVISNVYKYASPHAIGSLLNGMRTGSTSALYAQMFEENGIWLLFGVIIICAGVVLLIYSVSMRVMKLRGFKGAAYFACFAIFGGIWFLIDSNFMYMSLIIPYPVFNNMIDVLSFYFLPIFSALLIADFLSSFLRRVMHIFASAAIAVAIAVVLLQLFRAYDLHETQAIGITICALCALLGLGSLLYEALRLSRKEARMLLLSLSPIIIGIFIEYVIFMTAHIDVRIWFRVGFALSAFIMFMYILRYSHEKTVAAERTERLEKELLQSHVTVMLSQIKPHFLYNALNTIGSLCLTDPARADEAVVCFSEYLRTNLNALDSDAMIPFERELAHIKNYVHIEQMRYGDRLHVEYDIVETDFMLPTLSLQPIVENAIRHGISKKPGGGTVTLRTAPGKDATLIYVEDDGVGFDTSAAAEKQDSVGLRNVRQRIELLCGGSVAIYSEPGRGTDVTVRLPRRPALTRKEKRHENNLR